MRSFDYFLDILSVVFVLNISAFLSQNLISLCNRVLVICSLRLTSTSVCAIVYTLHDIKCCLNIKTNQSCDKSNFMSYFENLHESQNSTCQCSCNLAQLLTAVMPELLLRSWIFGQAQLFLWQLPAAFGCCLRRGWVLCAHVISWKAQSWVSWVTGKQWVLLHYTLHAPDKSRDNVQVFFAKTKSHR